MDMKGVTFQITITLRCGSSYEPRRGIDGYYSIRNFEIAYPLTCAKEAYITNRETEQSHDRRLLFNS